ncbi:MAG: ABC transporter ATP-binding protein [Rhizobiaceae bacterium]
MLGITDLHLSYGKLTALRGVSFTVGQGEIVSIIGPNGAGKSTALRAISGLIAPASGSIAFDGRSLAGLKPEAIAGLGISMVPEGRRIFSRLTVEENLRVGTLMRSDRATAAADITLQFDRFPRLKERRHSPAGKLSGGEQQMLAIARALLTKPRLITVDEPSLGLAPRIIDSVYELFSELRAKEGLTLLIVEQNTERALAHADRIYILRNGAIQLTAPSASLRGTDAVQAAYFGYEHQP